MDRNLTSSQSASLRAQAEQDLLQLMLSDSDVSYPWNPAAPEAEAYLTAIEQETAHLGFSDDELTAYSHAFGDRLDQAWATILAGTETATLRQNILSKLSFPVPNDILDGIIQRTRQIIQVNLSLADQMVQIVQDAFPGFLEEDLQVLARPMANAMREAETDVLEVALRTVRCNAWTELSHVERARLSLAIARYTIAQMPAHEPGLD
jgi:hypothetical protein